MDLPGGMARDMLGKSNCHWSFVTGHLFEHFANDE
jgi:hypothetical protein